MDKFERGKRIETGAYDDVWIHGDDGVELIPLTAQERKATYEHMIKIMRDHDWYSFPFTEEECKKIIDNYHSDDEAFPIEYMLLYSQISSLCNEIDRRDIEAIMSTPVFEGDEIK